MKFLKLLLLSTAYCLLPTVTLAQGVPQGSAAESSYFGRAKTFGGNVTLRDPADVASESLSETSFATVLLWAGAGDVAPTAGVGAVYAHATGAGTLTQTVANMAIGGFGGRYYRFNYTVASSTGSCAATITTSFAATAQTLSLVNGSYSVVFQSAAAPGDFVISATSSSGGFTLTAVSLKQIIGGDLYVSGTTFLGNIASDPTGANGAIYYNQTSNKFRCYQAGAWTDCIPSAGALPAGSGTELQYRAGASTFGAVTSSSVSGANITLGGNLVLNANGSGWISATNSFFLQATETGITASRRMLEVEDDRTYDTTASARTGYGATFNAFGTRSAGANNLTNVGIYAAAWGGQLNYAAIFVGDVGINDSTPIYTLDVYENDAATITTTTILNLVHDSNPGPPSTNFGGGIRFGLESSTTADQDAGLISAIWTDATHVSRTSGIVLSAVNNAAAMAEVARFTTASGLMGSGSGSVPGIGFVADPDTGFATEASNTISLIAGGVRRMGFSAVEIRLGSAGVLTGGSSTDPHAGNDVGWERAAVSTWRATNGTTGSATGWINHAGQDFKTADQTVDSTTLTADSHLSITVTNGRKYSGKLVYHITAGDTVGDGFKFDFNGGTATATAFIADCYLTDGGVTIALTNARMSALSTAVSVAATTNTTFMFVCEFSFEPSGNGTFIPRFAKNADVGTGLTAKRGSNIVMDDIP